LKTDDKDFLSVAILIAEDIMIRKFLFNTRIGSAVGALLLLAVLSGNAENINTPYDFPVKPGTPAWKAFHTHAEKINACQIPDSILQHLSTKALITTCLNYPLNIDMFCYDDFQIGFQAVSSNFNGLMELLKRADISKELLPAYEKTKDADLPPRESVSQAGKYMRMEMLLAQPEVIGSFDTLDAMRLLRECWKKFSKKASRPDVFSCFTLSTACLVMSRILYNLKNIHGRTDISLSDETLIFLEKPGPATATLSVIKNIAEAAVSVLK
jgi:hypothetical protein